jgi:hypothetical protein
VFFLSVVSFFYFVWFVSFVINPSFHFLSSIFLPLILEVLIRPRSDELERTRRDAETARFPANSAVESDELWIAGGRK